MFRLGNKPICLFIMVFGSIVFSITWVIKGYLDVHYNLLVSINERTTNLENGLRKQLDYIVKEKNNVNVISTNPQNSPWLELENMEKHFKKNLFLGNAREKKSFLVMGVPTVYREKGFYIIDTLQSLVNNLDKKDWNKVVIVVFVADFRPDYFQKVLSHVKSNFSEEISAGLIQVIQPSASFYPSMENIPTLYGDSITRTIWRSKQSLDYAFLFYYCADLAQFYIQLEDDIIAEENYLEKISEFIRNSEDWAILEFGARGFIGMTYRSEHLKLLSKFVRFAYWTMPVDWTFRYFNDLFLNGKSHKTKSPIFKHVGQFSSLDGQVRKLEDINDYSEQIGVHIYQSKGGNPKAEIKTTMTEIVRPHEITNPYGNSGQFWSKKVQVGDTIDIIFENPTKISQFIISSGNSQHPADILYDTELLASTDHSCAKYTLLKTFFNSNIVKYNFDAAAGYIKCLQLKILSTGHDELNRPTWLIVSEIAVLV
ncbi:alpha-1,3-mannosyl-glycoprotein 4-beta-N-acetylglucosaminyltransferase A isoform X2 [Hydra vulgaris]|nr:alpha-1,3-mannosyl-glycoprotein 4-beta-N-acetylglucosaminyltransferase A-like isoform X2 [Hydra vulgaris]XP_047137690.1 alpha-1,3-mannosyl-glycoprotein 4-beta-N-acetylglucosaminyltransferase A-like isoform X2 [Hydra vulgaris]